MGFEQIGDSEVIEIQSNETSGSNPLMRSLFALLLLASAPLSGVAQSLAPAQILEHSADNSSGLQAPPQLLEQMLKQSKLLDGIDARSVPLWGTPDGHVLAMVSAGANTLPQLPQLTQAGTAAEWRLVDVTNIVSGGMLLRLGDNSAAHVSLAQTRISAPGIAKSGFVQGYGEAFCQNPGDVNTICANPALVAHGGEFRFGANLLASDNLNLDLSYGLSWLRRENTGANAHANGGYGALSAIGNMNLPTLVMPGMELADVQNSTIGALGRLKLNDQQTLALGASLSHIQLSIPGNAPLTSLNQAALSVGLEYGPFSGVLTGRVLGAADVLGTGAPGQRFTGLDLGISWHTPWRGMFSVGAQNLWSSGSLPYLNDPASHELDANQARVPYVQYHQDL